MPLQKLQFRPGLNREGTDYSNEGGWYDGDKVRFRSGFPEKIGGWTQFSPNQYDGVCRALWAWLDGDAGSGNVYVGVGTNTKYYIYSGGVYNNITPIVATFTLTNPFTTTSGSSSVIVTDNNYIPNIGDTVVFSGASAVGGLTIDGEYKVISTISNTEYTITADSAASSSATGGGTVTAEYEYPVGLNIYTTGTGWGAGLWNAAELNTILTAGSFVVGTKYVIETLGTTTNAQWNTIAGTSGITYSVSSTFVCANAGVGLGNGTALPYNYWYHGWGTSAGVGIGQQLRLWSNDNFGTDLVIAPRGGPIYYWADADGAGTRSKSIRSLANSTSSGVTDSSVSYASAATSITVSAAVAPNLYPGMYILNPPAGIPSGTFISSTYLTGSTTVPISSTTTAIGSGVSCTFSYSGEFTPVATYQAVTSAIQEFVIAFGSNSYSPNDPNTDFNSMIVRWSDQANPYQWVPTVTNQSGEYLLTNGSYIMGAKATRQEILVWTDSALYSMQYVGTPYVWGFQILMDNITIMSPNAMVTVNNVTYWMGKDRFYMYAGRVEVLPCALRQYIFDDINQDQAYQVFVGTNNAFNEIWWFYVSGSSGGTVVDRYVVYNYLDRVWYYGSMNRSAWYQSGFQQFPIAADYNSRLLNHENGNDDQATDVVAPIVSYVQSSDFDIGDGHNFGFVWRILPDINFNGSNVNDPYVTITVKPRQNSGTPYGQADAPQVQSSQNYLAQPQYTIQQFTGQVYTRLRGRQMSFRIDSDSLGVAWQLGSPRIDIRPDGRR